MTAILAIDPGPATSGIVEYHAAQRRVLRAGVVSNAEVLTMLSPLSYRLLAVEMIACYGMAVGAETFDTCVWIGRFVERYDCQAATRLVYRQAVKIHLCGSPRAKDPNVRQALIDRFGPGKDRAVGSKKAPGPLYAVKSHAWSALAVAVTTADQEDAA